MNWGKKCLLLLLWLLVIKPSSAQQLVSAKDSIKKYQQRFVLLKDESDLFELYFSKSRYFRYLNNDSSLYYANRGLNLAKKKHNRLWQTSALSNSGYALAEMGNLAKALTTQFEVLELSKNIKIKWKTIEGETLNSIGNIYLEMGDTQKALQYYQKSLKWFINSATQQLLARQYWIFNEKSNIGNTYEMLNMPDSALFYELNIYHNNRFPSDLRAELMGRLGNAYAKLGNYHDAFNFYNSGIKYADSAKAIIQVASIDYRLAKAYQHQNAVDSGIFYAKKAFSNSRLAYMRSAMLGAARLLADLYSSKAKIDSAYHYQQIAIRLNDTLFGPAKFNHIQHVLLNEQQRQQKLLQTQEELRNKYRMIGGIALVLFLLVIAFLIWLNYLAQRKKNHLLDARNVEIIEQRDKLQITLDELRRTQTQLIQSEKMASLGELTAGIAHEIQNPLNFVNNFSDVSAELVDEMQIELKNGDKDEAIAISEDIKQNLEKIRHHGKRADSIVKSMLQHSRASSGQKEPANLNALADEYLRLSYHGLRAKDKSFNAEILTNFDENLPKAAIVAQDIGRVLLNLFNNAFYAVHQKAKTAGPDYKPTVEVTTSRADGMVIISVKDNGIGMPDSIKEKIMQPFFTTKPTGEGTGLGLSLSYDIVVKGHEGSIAVESKDGEGSKFTISLPIKKI